MGVELTTHASGTTGIEARFMVHGADIRHACLLILFEEFWAGHVGQMWASLACHGQLPLGQRVPLVAAAAAAAVAAAVAVSQTPALETSLAWRC